MNETANKRDKFMPKLRLKQQAFTYSTYGPSTKRVISSTSKKKELDKAYFAYDAAYANSKVLAKGTISGKVWKDRANEIAINP